MVQGRYRSAGIGTSKVCRGGGLNKRIDRDSELDVFGASTQQSQCACSIIVCCSSTAAWMEVFGPHCRLRSVGSFVLCGSLGREERSTGCARSPSRLMGAFPLPRRPALSRSLFLPSKQARSLFDRRTAALPRGILDKHIDSQKGRK